MTIISIRGLSRAASQGKLDLGFTHFPCALGRGGRGVKNGEGDGITPIGRWPIRHVLFRPDRVSRPYTALSVAPISIDMGWCDAAGDPNYNRIVHLPYPASHERLWRTDHLYDIIVVLGFNDWPRAQGRGSAIFMHLARSGYRPTEGCIALSLEHMLKLLKHLQPHDVIAVA